MRANHLANIVLNQQDTSRKRYSNVNLDAPPLFSSQKNLQNNYLAEDGRSPPVPVASCAFSARKMQSDFAFVSVSYLEKSELFSQFFQFNLPLVGSRP